jgi:hypothetical protein
MLSLRHGPSMLFVRSVSSSLHFTAQVDSTSPTPPIVSLFYAGAIL